MLGLLCASHPHSCRPVDTLQCAAPKPFARLPATNRERPSVIAGLQVVAVPPFDTFLLRRRGCKVCHRKGSHGWRADSPKQACRNTDLVTSQVKKEPTRESTRLKCKPLGHLCVRLCFCVSDWTYPHTHTQGPVGLAAKLSTDNSSCDYSELIAEPRDKNASPQLALSALKSLAIEARVRKAARPKVLSDYNSQASSDALDPGQTVGQTMPA